MPRQTSSGVASLLAALALGACASTAKGVMPASELSHIESVEVVEHDATAPPAFADVLQKAIVQEAVAYGDAGRPVALRVEIEKVHFKNALQAMLIGDDNMTKGQVSVIDPATGAASGTFAMQVNAERPGGGGISFAAMIVGALDPTGLVSIGQMAGEASSADINRGGTVAGMIANFSEQALRQTFGDTKAKAASIARQKAAKH